MFSFRKSEAQLRWRRDSGASPERGDQFERVEAIQLGDCGQETALINRLTSGSRVFLSREESQHFIKEHMIHYETCA
ncbi:hypothetical protein cypCar_00006908 [Cyprinus carpio]|nr:hypothetical protein cypCar_00006908 [Cyprinus carpio]